MSTAAVTADPWEQYAEKPESADKWEKYAEKSEATKEQPGFLDKDIPLDSYTHATESGVQSLGRGLRSAVQGVGRVIAHPIDTAGEMFRSAVNLPYEAAQVPAAVHDINQAPDPISHFGRAAQDTAGDAFGQTAVTLGTAGLGRVARLAAGSIPESVATAPVRLGSRAVEGVVNSAPGKWARSAMRIMTPADEAGVHIKVPGRDFGLPKPVYPGAPLPEAPPVYPGAPLPEHPGVYPGANLPENPGVFPGAPYPGVPSPELLNPSLVSESRTLPGQVGREVIRPPRGPTAQPIPPRTGLALPEGADPLLERLRGHASRIAEVGHGDEIPEPPEATAATTNFNEDLTPALKASLRKALAAKRSARARSAPIQ